MFVIGRAVHEQIQIGNTITIKVLRIGDKYVTLGIDAPKAVPLPRSQAAGHRSGLDAESAAGGDLSVLIVDGTPIHTWLAQKAFTAFGVDRTRIARSGREAIRLLGIHDSPPEPVCSYDLIVMEFRLPDMSGLELIGRIRSSPGTRVCPIVVMSYQDADIEVMRCLEAGANAFVPKPETQEGFRQTIFRLADFWRHARRAAPVGVPGPVQESLVC